MRIVGQAEGTSFELVPGFVEAYLNDCIEFFIDLGTVCRQYRFVCKFVVRTSSRRSYQSQQRR